jgi:DNA end-binding protein Ku
VEEDQEVKGYARDESSFVLLEDEELEAVQLESARTIDIESFAPADSDRRDWEGLPTRPEPVTLEGRTVDDALSD